METTALIAEVRLSFALPQGKGDGVTRVGLAAEKGSRAVGDIANRDIDRLLGDNRRHMEGERIAFKGHTIGIVEHIAGISHGDGNGEAPGTVRTLHCWAVTVTLLIFLPACTAVSFRLMVTVSRAEALLVDS